jgi:hypothetical protein
MTCPSSASCPQLQALDLVPLLAANPDIAVEKIDPLGSTTMLRFNQLNPPFNNVKMRQAVLAVTDQAEFMSVLAGHPKNWGLCPSFFTCGTPMANTAGSEAPTGKRDFDKARIARRPRRVDLPARRVAGHRPGDETAAAVHLVDLALRLGRDRIGGINAGGPGHRRIAARYLTGGRRLDRRGAAFAL